MLLTLLKSSRRWKRHTYSEFYSVHLASLFDFFLIATLHISDIYGLRFRQVRRWHLCILLRVADEHLLLFGRLGRSSAVQRRKTQWNVKPLMSWFDDLEPRCYYSKNCFANTLNLQYNNYNNTIYYSYGP